MFKYLCFYTIKIQTLNTLFINYFGSSPSSFIFLFRVFHLDFRAFRFQVFLPFEFLLKERFGKFWISICKNVPRLKTFSLCSLQPHEFAKSFFSTWFGSADIYIFYLMKYLLHFLNKFFNYINVAQIFKFIKKC